jgi:hypothetical protein
MWGLINVILYDNERKRIEINNSYFFINSEHYYK